MGKASTRKIVFTQARLEKLSIHEAAHAAVYWHDERMPGLSFSITPKGHRSYYIYCSHHGKPYREKLGDFAHLTVEQARDLCREKRVLMARGMDPRTSKSAPATEEPTFGDLWQRWLMYARSHKKTWEVDEQRYHRHLESWEQRKLSSITKADAAAVHAKVGADSGPYMANRILQLASAMFNKSEELIGWTGPNPCSRISHFPEPSRTRFLSGDELARLFTALEATAEHWRVYFYVCLLTAARGQTVRAMKWADLDFTHALWLVSGADMKCGQPVGLPLVPRVVALLQIWRQRCPSKVYVFPSSGSATGHLQSPKAAWRKIRIAAGLEDVRPHDLRRSCASWGAMAGVPLKVLGDALGQRSSSAIQVYARLSPGAVATGLNTAVDAMFSAAMHDAGYKEPTCRIDPDSVTPQSMAALRATMTKFTEEEFMAMLTRDHDLAKRVRDKMITNFADLQPKEEENEVEPRQAAG